MRCFKSCSANCKFASRAFIGILNGTGFDLLMGRLDAGNGSLGGDQCCQEMGNRFIESAGILARKQLAKRREPPGHVFV